MADGNDIFLELRTDGVHAAFGPEEGHNLDFFELWQLSTASYTLQVVKTAAQVSRHVLDKPRPRTKPYQPGGHTRKHLAVVKLFRRQSVARVAKGRTCIVCRMRALNLISQCGTLVCASLWVLCLLREFCVAERLVKILPRYCLVSIAVEVWFCPGKLPSFCVAVKFRVATLLPQGDTQSGVGDSQCCPRLASHLKRKHEIPVPTTRTKTPLLIAIAVTNVLRGWGRVGILLLNPNTAARYTDNACLRISRQQDEAGTPQDKHHNTRSSTSRKIHYDTKTTTKRFATLCEPCSRAGTAALQRIRQIPRRCWYDK